MSNQIDIILALKSANALAELNSFVNSSVQSIKRLAEEALAAWVSIEGIHKIIDFEKDALRLEESIGKLSKVTGLSVETIVAMRTAATETGTPFEQLTQSLGKFAQMVYEAATQGGKAADAFHMMGISLVGTDGTLRSTDAIFREFVVRFAQMADGPQKTAFAMQVMGRSARESIVMLNEAAEAMDKMSGKSPITDESVLRATEFNRGLRELHEAVEDLFIEVVNKMLPALREISEGFLSASRNAEAHHAIVTSLVGIFKGVVTVVSIAGMAFYELGSYIGQVANLLVDNFNVAVDTCKKLLVDLARFLIDDANLVLDFVKAVFVANQAGQEIIRGHFGAARDIIRGEFEALKGDVLKITSDIGKGITDVYAGSAQGITNTLSFAGSYGMQLMDNWEKMSGFLKDLWNETGKPSSPHNSPTAPSIVPVSQTGLRDLSTLQGLLQAIAKQQIDLINDDPFKSQVEKIRELLPLLEKQREIIFDEYAAAQSQLSNPNLNESQRLAVLKDLVKLQGELNKLESEERNLKMKGDFVGQMQAGLIKLNDRITDFSTNAAALSLATMQRMVDGVSASIYAAMQGTKNWGEAFSRAMGQAVQGIIQMVTQWIAGRLAMMAVDTAFSASSKANSATTTASAVPAGIAQAGAQGGWVGILIYVGVFLAAMAALMAITSAVARERGGPVTAGQPYIVGEKRPELFVPDSSGFIMPEVPSASSSGGGSGASMSQINLHMHGGESAALKAMRTSEGQNFIIDLNKKNVKRIHG